MALPVVALAPLPVDLLVKAPAVLLVKSPVEDRALLLAECPLRAPPDLALL